MIYIKDSEDKKISGLYKDNLGNIIINNMEEFNKYKREQKHIEEFNIMKSDIKELKDKLNSILQNQLV
jgi:hypothetical protein